MSVHWEEADSARTESGPCPICGGDFVPGGRAIHSRSSNQPGSVFEIRVCSACGSGLTLRTSPAQPPDALQSYPSGYGEFDWIARPGVERLATMARSLDLRSTGSTHYAELVEPGGSKTRLDGIEVLEIGCGSGRFLKSLVDSGAKVQGVEPIAASVAIARRAGLNVQCSTLEKAELPADHFDRVYLVHSLEHIPDPKSCMRRVGQLIRPGGFVVVAVPNFDSPVSRFFYSSWVGLDIPRHLSHFTPEGLTRLMKFCGLEVQGLSYESSLEDIPRSGLNALLGHLQRRRTTRPARASRFQRFVELGMDRLSGPVLGLLYGPLLTALKCPSNRYMVVVATRKIPRSTGGA